ncbi:MAG: hypothetical protein L6R42_011452, partial [Xanthoria sp. 1 TBL-2021]
STGPISLLSKAPKVQNSKRKKQRSLNALAIAEKTIPNHTKIRKHRLGESEPDGDAKRKRVVAQRNHPDDSDGDEDLDQDVTSKRRKTKNFGNHGKDKDYGSESEGNEWMPDAVDNEDDESLDSDEAMGESDEEKFEGFVFRGSSSATAKRQTRIASEAEGTFGEIDLSEGDGEIDDDFGDEGVDMAAVLDAASEIENEQDITGEFEPPESNENIGRKVSEDEDSGNLVSDEENDLQNSEKFAALQSL